MVLLSSRAATRSDGSSDRPSPNATRMNGARPRSCRLLCQFLGRTIHDASCDDASHRAAIPDSNSRDANRDHATRRRGAIARMRRGNCWQLKNWEQVELAGAAADSIIAERAAAADAKLVFKSSGLCEYARPCANR